MIDIHVQTLIAKHVRLFPSTYKVERVADEYILSCPTVYINQKTGKQGVRRIKYKNSKALLKFLVSEFTSKIFDNNYVKDTRKVYDQLNTNVLPSDHPQLVEIDVHYRQLKTAYKDTITETLRVMYNL